VHLNAIDDLRSLFRFLLFSDDMFLPCAIGSYTHPPGSSTDSHSGYLWFQITLPPLPVLAVFGSIPILQRIEGFKKVPFPPPLMPFLLP